MKSVNSYLSISTLALILISSVLFAQSPAGPSWGSGSSAVTMKVSELDFTGTVTRLLPQPSSDSTVGLALSDTSTYEQDSSSMLCSGVSSPNLSASFQGITAAVFPSSVIAAGKNHIIQAVNSSITIYAKTGEQIIPVISLEHWFKNVLDSLGDNIFFPQVTYDQYIGRWIVMAVGTGVGNSGLPQDAHYYIAVSKTDDPTQEWYLYKIDGRFNGSNTSDTSWAGYPGLGYDQEALYITSIQHNISGNVIHEKYSRVRVFDKSQLYAGNTVTWVDFWNMQNTLGYPAYDIKPVKHFGAGGGGYLLYKVAQYHSGRHDRIEVWKVNNPTGSSPSLQRIANVPVGYFSNPPEDAHQPDSLFMPTDANVHEAIYQNGFLYTAFTIGYDWGSGEVSAVRYLKVNVTTKKAEINATYGQDGIDYYFPSICPDALGNLVMVFNRSSQYEYPAIRWTYRLTTDNAMRPSEVLKCGAGLNYVNYYYGNYNGIALDPENPRRIWFTSDWAHGDYIDSTATWIGSFTNESVPVSVDQLLANGTRYDSSKVGRWHNGNFTDYKPRVPYSFQAFVGTTEALDGEHGLYTGGSQTQKYHQWQDQQEISNPHSFTILNSSNIFISQFKDSIATGITVRNKLLEIPSTEVGNIYFKNPWRNDQTYSRYNNYIGNEAGLATPKQETSPFNSTLSSDHQGVFLNENKSFNSTLPIYTVQADLTQTFMVNGTPVTSYFIDWNALSTDAQFKNQTILEPTKDIVFLKDNAKAEAEYKGHLISGSGMNNSLYPALARNNQRAMCTGIDNTNANYTHLVYTSVGKVWYTRESQGGEFGQEVQISRLNTAYNTSITQYLGKNDHSLVGIVWEERTGGLTDIYFSYSENNGTSFSTPELLVSGIVLIGGNEATPVIAPIRDSRSSIYSDGFIIAYRGTTTISVLVKRLSGATIVSKALPLKLGYDPNTNTAILDPLHPSISYKRICLPNQLQDDPLPRCHLSFDVRIITEVCRLGDNIRICYYDVIWDELNGENLRIENFYDMGDGKKACVASTYVNTQNISTAHNYARAVWESQMYETVSCMENNQEITKLLVKPVIFEGTNQDNWSSQAMFWEEEPVLGTDCPVYYPVQHPNNFVAPAGAPIKPNPGLIWSTFYPTGNGITSIFSASRADNNDGTNTGVWSIRKHREGTSSTVSGFPHTAFGYDHSVQTFSDASGFPVVQNVYQEGAVQIGSTSVFRLHTGSGIEALKQDKGGKNNEIESLDDYTVSYRYGSVTPEGIDLCRSNTYYVGYGDVRVIKGDSPTPTRITLALIPDNLPVTTLDVIRKYSSSEIFSLITGDVVAADMRFSVARRENLLDALGVNAISYFLELYRPSSGITVAVIDAGVLNRVRGLPVSGRRTYVANAPLIDVAVRLRLTSTVPGARYTFTEGYRYRDALQRVNPHESDPLPSVISGFSLEQNYPNPFSTSSTISYELPEELPVTLVVYDALGKEVARLVDETKTAGVHEAEFKTENLPNGVYTYKLTAGKYMQTRTMIVMR